MKVYYHSGDFDGIGSKEVFRHFFDLQEKDLIGWDFGDPTFPYPEHEDMVVVVDLNPGSVFGTIPEEGSIPENLVWIDHHISAIKSHPEEIKGYRIDGVAACRLAWQWCLASHSSAKVTLPTKQSFVDRMVDEPLVIQLLGEYDIWDKRNPDAELLQLGLKAQRHIHWETAFIDDGKTDAYVYCGGPIQDYLRVQRKRALERSAFLLEFEGLTFLAMNSASNSLAFEAMDRPECGHDALLAFNYDGKKWRVSMYHAAHRKDIDLSIIANRMGGGGHKGACGFETKGFENILHKSNLPDIEV